MRVCKVLRGGETGVCLLQNNSVRVSDVYITHWFCSKFFNSFTAQFSACLVLLWFDTRRKLAIKVFIKSFDHFMLKTGSS